MRHARTFATGDGTRLAVSARRLGSRRLNAGSPADSEGSGRTSKSRKRPFPGEKVGAASGVEPMMDVLQMLVGRAEHWSAGRDCVAQSQVLGELYAGPYSDVWRRGEGSCRQSVGGNSSGWRPGLPALTPGAAARRKPHEWLEAVQTQSRPRPRRSPTAASSVPAADVRTVAVSPCPGHARTGDGPVSGPPTNGQSRQRPL